MRVSVAKNQILVTHSLGSCLGLASMTTCRVGGLIH
jgi:chemotaxis receptor (MCP) glutamine deamidase CheD